MLRELTESKPSENSERLTEGPVIADAANQGA